VETFALWEESGEVMATHAEYYLLLLRDRQLREQPDDETRHRVNAKYAYRIKRFRERIRKVANAALDS
jgi:hypothetical protein